MAFERLVTIPLFNAVVVEGRVKVSAFSVVRAPTRARFCDADSFVYALLANMRAAASPRCPTHTTPSLALAIARPKYSVLSVPNAAYQQPESE